MSRPRFEKGMKVRLTRLGHARGMQGRAWGPIGVVVKVSPDGYPHVQRRGIKRIGVYHPDFWEEDPNA